MKDNSHPKVSIILPTYNRAGYIMETIESVRSQTFSNWELIIMDDGSDDNTEELVRKTGDNRIQFHKLSRSGKVSQIKNIAMRKGPGEFIAFIDSDDLWAPTKLEKQIIALNEHPEAGFCLVGGYGFKEKDRPVVYFYKQREGALIENIFISMFRSEVSGFTQALLFKKNCLQVSGYFDETKNFSDPDFLVSLAFHFKAVILFEPLLYRRLHESSDSNEYWQDRYFEWIRVIRSYRGKKMLPGPIARTALFKLYINFGEKCLVFDQYSRAFTRFFNAWRRKPFSIISYKKMAKALIYGLKRK